MVKNDNIDSNFKMWRAYIYELRTAVNYKIFTFKYDSFYVNSRKKWSKVAEKGFSSL